MILPATEVLTRMMRVGGWVAMTQSFRIAILSGWLPLAMSAQGALLISFDGSAGLTGATIANQSVSGFSSTGSANLGGEPTISDRRGTRYALSTPLFANSANYTGPSIYGGYESVLFDATEGNIHAATQLVENSLTDVRIRIGFNNTSSYPGSPGAAVSGLVYFQTGIAGATFDGTSQLSLTMTANSRNATGRWVVNDGGNYYVSSTTFALGSGTQTLLDPASVTWAAYAVAASALNFNQASATYSTRTFTDIQGAGVYFENDAVGNSGLGPQLEMTAFSLNAVPEPSVLASVACGMVLLVRRRR